ncbi:Uncharacterised protein [Serratia marcescens]|uniref:hypothetical protein n=1 Tax=Serratia marcescens TaxID=615 RepID=UPI00217AAF26|nr:hypothetical protein [Serratia marcescens]CAI1137913.1 Uncharacterised protein [Serratia marcescens]CAI1145722.1 Uncharacterised protein [Serratia marcescens]CAI1940394.1 Uncharacterised protein [Serratia marcescens]CAI1998803.1 Uncharacterised protein [Serratia marcescens]
MKKTIAALLAVCTPLNVYAGLYPVVTDVNVEYTTDFSRIINLTWGMVDLPEADTISTPINATISVVARKNVCTLGKCSIVLDQTLDGPTKNCMRGSFGRSLGEEAVDLFTTGRCNISTLIEINDTSLAECIGFAMTSYGGPNTNTIGYLSWPPLAMPAGACTPIPPANNWCKIVDSSIFIDHGSLRSGDINGKRAMTPMSVECTAPMGVSIKFAHDTISLGTIKSQLSVLGGNKVSLKKGMNTLEVMSTLQGDSKDGGVFQGSTVVYVDYY